MEPYITVDLFIVFVCVIALSVISLRLERENKQLRTKYIIMLEIAKSLFEVSDRLIGLHDDLDRHNGYEQNDEPPSTPGNF